MSVEEKPSLVRELNELAGEQSGHDRNLLLSVAAAVTSAAETHGGLAAWERVESLAHFLAGYYGADGGLARAETDSPADQRTTQEVRS
jgi:hypothetical protein